MFKYIIIGVLAVLLSGCIFGDDASGSQGFFPDVHMELQGGIYDGGVYKLWVNLNGVMATPEVTGLAQKRDSLSALLQTALSTTDRIRAEKEYDFAYDELGKHVAQIVSWNTGSGLLAHHFPVIQNGQITSDTVYILWESLPPIKVDSTMIDSIYVLDSLIVDTVNVEVNNAPSRNIIVDIQNIATRIDSVMVNALVMPVRSQNYREPITIFGRAGQTLSFSLYISDGYHESPAAPGASLIGFPIMSHGMNEDGTILSYSLSLPGNVLDTIVDLVLYETQTIKRVYRARIIAYEEVGSLWIGDENDLVKATANGTEILRLKNQFGRIVDIAVNPGQNAHAWVVDEAGVLYRFNENGIVKFADSSIIHPQAVALDHFSNELWLASGVNNNALVQHFQYADSGLTEMSALNEVAGYVSDIVVDYSEHNAWYVNPVTDSLFMVRDSGKVLDPAEFNSFFTFHKPVSVSYDQGEGQMWIADSNGVYLVNSNGTGIGSISGFKEISKISAANGICWIVDTKAGQVVKLGIGDMTSFNTVPELTAGVHVFSGYKSPLGVVIDKSDGGCWVTDTEVGSIVKLNASGVEVSRNSGYNRPSVIARNQ